MKNVLIYFRKQFILAAILLIITFITSCAHSETWKAAINPSASHDNSILSLSSSSKDNAKQPSRESKDHHGSASIPEVTPTIVPSPTPTQAPSILGPDYDAAIDLHAGPVPLPLKILIPVLEVDAPILGVGLTKDNNMDAPKGLYGDPNWSSAFWFRGSAIPGEPGTATIAGHVNGPGGEPETFAQIRKLKPGDLIIIKVKNTNTLLYFVVDEVKKYSMAELIEPDIADRIFGSSAGSGGQHLTDGVSHLTLITCTGNYIDGEFDHRRVVFSTLRN